MISKRKYTDVEIKDILRKLALDQGGADYCGSKIPSRHAAAITRRGKIISLGVNKYNKSHPLQRKYNPRSIFLHAEVDALIRASSMDLRNGDVQLWVCRVNSFGDFRLSKPCRGCAKAIGAFGIVGVRYSTGNRWGTLQWDKLERGEERD